MMPDYFFIYFPFYLFLYLFIHGSLFCAPLNSAVAGKNKRMRECSRCRKWSVDRPGIYPRVGGGWGWGVPVAFHLSFAHLSLSISPSPPFTFHAQPPTPAKRTLMDSSLFWAERIPFLLVIRREKRKFGSAWDSRSRGGAFRSAFKLRKCLSYLI